MKKFLVLLLIASLLTFSGCSDGNKSNNDNLSSKENENTEILSEITVTEEIDVGGMDLEFTDNDKNSNYSNSAVKATDENEDIIKITTDGIFKVTGNHSQIVVNAPDTAKPKIILENVNISCENGPAIYIESADKVFITLADGSDNTLSCGTGFDESYDNADGTIFSKADLTINGGGSLVVNGDYKCGIVSKDDLNIVDTNISVTSVGTAIEGKDCVKITNSNITVDAGTDGIKSTNSEDGARGYVLIESGKFKITSNNDAVQAETALFIRGGEFEIETGGGSAVSSSNYGNENNNWGMWGGNTQSSSSTDTESAKALKAVSLIEIDDGSFSIDSSDDAIHSNSDLEIKGGSFNIASGDDGIHADDQMIISGGRIEITKSYEGIEATAITVSDGNIDVTASDDGFNAAGGNDSSALSGRPGQNPFESDSNAQINFTGGYILVDASGDGIDSNGDITLSGGVLLVSGPTNSGNGSLDYGGTAVVNGGVAVIVGSSGMATTFSSSSSQASFMYNINAASADSFVSVTDGDKVIASFKPKKDFNNVIVSSPSLNIGDTYTLNIGGSVAKADSNGYTDNGTVSSPDSEYEIELSSVSYSNAGGMGDNIGGGMHGRPGGRGW